MNKMIIYIKNNKLLNTYVYYLLLPIFVVFSL